MTLSVVAKGLSEKELEGASNVARDRERIKRAKHEERARDMISRTLING